MMPRSFDKFVEEGVVRRITPDLNRADYLVDEAKKRYDFLLQLIEKFDGINDINANSVIENCYNIIIELLRAIMLKQGYYASGLNAHEAEVSFMLKLGFPETDVWFMNKLRCNRNGILYYGKLFDKEYAVMVYNFLNKVYQKLIRLIEKK